MRVLIECEFSAIVREAFRKRGHDAWSCDLLPSDIKGQHHQGDVYDMLDHKWDLIIAHPPCTALGVCGNSTYGWGKKKHKERIKAVRWTKNLWLACKSVSESVCFENPVGVLTKLGGLPGAQFIQPYQFGHLEQKKTGLHLHNLPDLEETNNVYDEMMKLPKNKRERIHYLPPSADRWKIRSTTFQGIADAMAEQWG